MILFNAALADIGLDAILGQFGAGSVLVVLSSGDVVLATVPLENPPFDAASGGVAILSGTPIVVDEAEAGGTATKWQMRNDGATRVLQGTVGVAGSGASLIVNSTTVSAGEAFTLLSGQVEAPLIPA